MVGFSNPPNDAALVRTVLAGDPVGLRTGRKDREAAGARRGLVQEVGSDVLGLPRHRPADPLGRGGRAPDPMAGRFSDLAVASTNHRKTEASSAASGGAYVLRRLTPSQTAKVQLRAPNRTSATPRKCRVCKPPNGVLKGTLIPPALHENVEEAVLVHRTPEPVLLAGDFYGDLVQ